MRVLAAHVYHESNTFCLEKTRLEDFECREEVEMLSILPGVDVLQEAGIEVIPSIYAQRWSSGTVEVRALLHFEDRILHVLRQWEGQLDGIFLSLHGGMTVETLGSGEFHLLSVIRAEVGEKLPIAVPQNGFHRGPQHARTLCHPQHGYYGNSFYVDDALPGQCGRAYTLDSACGC